MIKALIREFPVTDILDDMTEEKIRRYAYTKDEVDALIAEAVAEARRIDEASMAKHNREATVISMILGFTALALFVDGLLRLLGIIPPFIFGIPPMLLFIPMLPVGICPGIPIPIP